MSEERFLDFEKNYDRFFASHPDQFYTVIPLCADAEISAAQAWVQERVPNKEFCIYYHNGAITVLESTPRSIDCFGIFSRHIWSHADECPGYDAKKRIRSKHIYYNSDNYYESTIERLWKLRHSTLLYCTKSYAATIPIADWVEERADLRGQLLPRKELPRNLVTRAHMVSLSVTAEHDNPVRFFYCVKKSSGFDFWLVPHRNAWTVVNAGGMTPSLLEEISSYLALHRCPPRDCLDYLSCETTTDPLRVIFAHIRPYANPGWFRDPRDLLAATVYMGIIRVVNSTVALHVVLPGRTVKRFQTKRSLGAEHVPAHYHGVIDCRWYPDRCYKCQYRRGEHPSCNGAGCKLMLCTRCIEDTLRQYIYGRCICWQPRTLLWWTAVAPERFAFVTVSVAPDTPDRLLDICLARVAQLKMHTRLTECEVPRTLIERLRALS